MSLLYSTTYLLYLVTVSRRTLGHREVLRTAPGTRVPHAEDCLRPEAGAALGRVAHRQDRHPTTGDAPVQEEVQLKVDPAADQRAHRESGSQFNST